MKKLLSVVIIFIFSLNIVACSNVNKEQGITIYDENTPVENLEKLSIKELTEVRDKGIDKNLEELSEFGKEIVEEYKDGILNSDYGLISFIDNNYNKLAEKEKLIKEIKIVKYENYINERMDPAGSFFKLSNENYQLSEYLIQNGKSPDITSYENLKYLVNNYEELSNFVDYNLEGVLEGIIYDSSELSPSKNEIRALIKELREY